MSNNFGKFEGMVLEKLNNIERQLCKKVDRNEFLPVKAITYGLVGLILAGVITAILASVVKALIK